MLFQPKQEVLPKLQPLLKKEERKRKFSRGDRWRVVILFGATVLACLFFWFKTEAPRLWQKVNTPLVLSSRPHDEEFNPSPVLAKIEALTADLEGTYGIYVYQLGEEREYGLYFQEVFPAASLIKLPVIFALYQQAEKGEVSLEDKYALVGQDKIGGAGILSAQKTGAVYTYRQLARFMGQYSDNTAFGVIRRILGDKVIGATIRDLGMKRTSLEKNETTPEEIGLFFQKLYWGEGISEAHREEILALLTKTAFEDRLPAGLPRKVRVAHKIGTEIGSFSDAGIVFAERPFILVIMSKAARESEALKVLPEIAKVVWEFENNR